MLTRTIMLPLAALISAAVIDGAILGGASFLGRPWTGWPVVGGLAALVIATLAEHSRAAAAEVENEPGAVLAAVDGQTKLIASGLVIAGLAVVLGAFAPRGGPGFATWAGLATVTMGFMLAVLKCAFGRYRTPRETPSAGAE